MNHSNQQNHKPKQECLFHTYASKDGIMNKMNSEHIVSNYYHPQYPTHVIAAFFQAEKMLGLVGVKADVGVDEDYEFMIFIFAGLQKICHLQHLVYS